MHDSLGTNKLSSRSELSALLRINASDIDTSSCHIDYTQSLNSFSITLHTTAFLRFRCFEIGAALCSIVADDSIILFITNLHLSAESVRYREEDDRLCIGNKGEAEL